MGIVGGGCGAGGRMVTATRVSSLGAHGLDRRRRADDRRLWTAPPSF